VAALILRKASEPPKTCFFRSVDIVPAGLFETGNRR